jgi:hypothetical protein
MTAVYPALAATRIKRARLGKARSRRVSAAPQHAGSGLRYLYLLEAELRLLAAIVSGQQIGPDDRATLGTLRRKVAQKVRAGRP